jgi:RecA-family ATPase
VLADKLPAGGLSILSAKPKVGKSTWARGLCLAVARGVPFLGCATTHGPVIYLALEEKRSEVRRHFQDLGATGEEPIFVHVASAPQDAVPELCALAKKVKPILIVIDPLFKLVRVRDEKAYAEVCAAIEPVLNLARETGAHVLATHHNGKME